MVDGALEIHIKVSPGARSNRIVGPYGDRLKVRVAAPPERGRANQMLCEFLAGVFGLPIASVEIVAGFSSPDKRIRVHGLQIEDLQQFAWWPQQ